ncbi:tetratricopeptide repeat protein [Legionella cardiaca]|uniref:Tetratricopeptide repeat protein n=1 Tax=Legionella cardiaca TaxID=1071983 RepID=A0ABY8ASM3_9GAMM|nr:tetratricopeptide repeat protein [Legionella cardiaca]WED43668.1 tetratricopeptide repeat protein [Legionella cardiaca]
MGSLKMQEKKENNGTGLTDNKLIMQLSQMYPRDYSEMHEKQPLWSELKEKLPQALEYIKTLQTRQDDTALELLGNLSHNVGVFCTHVIENYPQALELLNIALKTKKTRHPIDDESLALTHTHLADCAYRNGNYVLAISQFELANEAYKRKEGLKHCDLDRAFVLHASGNAYYNIGAYAKALEVFSEAEKIRLKYLAKDAIEFGYLEHDHADVLTALGKYKESEELFNSSLEKKKRYFKTEKHTNIALLYQCRALLYLKSSQFEKSQKNLEQAYTIYSSHTENFATEYQPDLFRNYFYSIILQLAIGDLKQAEAEIDHFNSQLQTTENRTKPVFVRLAQAKIRLYQCQNKTEETFRQLQESISRFIPNLKFETADKILTPDNKFDVAILLSQFAVELYIHNNYQNFNDCLAILNLALQLKESFYNALPPAIPALGTINYAFSDYDFGSLYYLAALNCKDKQERQGKLDISARYFEAARKKFLDVGMNEDHNNIIACLAQLNKIKEFSCSQSFEEEASSKKITIPRRISFFPVTCHEQSKISAIDCIPSLDTIIMDYP